MTEQTQDTSELKKKLLAYNERASKKMHLQTKLKIINAELKELQADLVDWLLENNKTGFNVDDGMAEIKLRKRTPKLTVNKKHATERLSALFAEKEGVTPELAEDCVQVIWSNLEKPDAPTTYWLEKKEISETRKRKRAEMEEAELLEKEGHVDNIQSHMKDLVRDSE